MKNAKDLYWEEKRRRRREEIRGAVKKWTTEGGRFYTTGLPTELLTENRIIFFFAVALNPVGIFVGIVLKFALKFWKSLQIFQRPSAKWLVTMCQSTCTLDLPCPSAKFVGNCADRLGSLTVVRVRMCIIHRWMRWYIRRWKWEGP
jgi:hypothetical protein